MVTTFTPYASFFGGTIIGLGTVILMLMLGRVLGATGILAGFLMPTSFEDWRWRAAVIAGMVTGPVVYLMFAGEFPAIDVPVRLPMLLIGGFIVGIGVTYGGGCTSGHGVCGLARLSPRSIVATVVFMVVCALTVFVIRHGLGG